MSAAMAEEQRWCMVTGGRGFVARHLVEMLLRLEKFHIQIVDLAPEIKLQPREEAGVVGEAMRSGRIQYVSADLRDRTQVFQACEGAEVVFHMAAPDPLINSYQLHYSVNVQGTKNVIDACIELGVKRLIYTSTSGVVFDGVHSVLNANESMPYPSKHSDSYTETKSEAEALVLSSNGCNGLLTCCLRPSAIFGPGDGGISSLVSAAKGGTFKFIIGDGNNLFDWTYTENIAHAHICAERALASGGDISEKASGQAYFITNMEPTKFWDFVSEIIEGLGYERPSIKIPVFVVMPIAYLVELIYKLFGPNALKLPHLTPWRVRFISLSTTFDCSKAKERLGYTPIVPLQEGIRRTVDFFLHLKSENQPDREDPFSTNSQWSLFLKAAFVLIVSGFFGALSVRSLLAIGIPVAFVVSLMYAKKGREFASAFSRLCGEKSD
ncbi:PREDICTED: 3beta-hydroxysteroid-dehydrogenase/decarboxylase-like [Tarenaya hassleriana]|uniref:3beta-hydroxysteroid- dehydrogenase/decarboxylase-like n=1 Tax=Tarenaya hassleriana TaxID=28532 RepID=UPI00053C8159|nr:PREDICTED: 3beta-hydroxysteroid-dehydrogenase/decarboxylase-like [Tarenaya hassleriana]